MAHETHPIEGIQGQECSVVKYMHTWPVATKSYYHREGTPSTSSIRASHNLHLTIIDTGATASLIGHEVHDERATNVDDLRSTGFEIVGGGIDPDAGVPRVAVVLGEDSIDGEGAGGGILKDAAILRVSNSYNNAEISQTPT